VTWFIVTRPDRIYKVWLPIAVFGVLWVELVRELSKQWEAREQYAYGWFVPFLALGLFWRKWATRTAAAQHSTPGWAWVLVTAVALSLLPIRVVHEINADWPLCGWLLALDVVVLTLYGVFLAGGWPWARHFSFPVCFILVAVIWPYRLEHGLTQGLMRAVAALDVELLSWFNMPAFQHGNLIEVNTGVVSIDEACSGIRSLQSTVMAALFLGELYLLTRSRRALLLIGGVVAAFCFNVLRTFILTWRASSSGLAALESWHDPAGLTIFVASFFCLWAMALWLRTNREHGIFDFAPRSPMLHAPCSMPRGYLMAVGCWALCVAGANELWYQAHESKKLGDFQWSVRFPTNAPAYMQIDLTPAMLSKMGSDIDAAGEWADDAGLHWTAYFFRWNPTSIESVLRARIHRPERCLPAAGLRLVADGGLVYFQTGNLQLPFRQYTYESEGRVLQVFFCQWEDGDEKQGGMWESKLADRIRSVLVGRRKLGQQTLELILTGSDTLKEAAQALRTEIPSLIKMENAPTPTALRALSSVLSPPPSGL
jgi:exosortase